MLSVNIAFKSFQQNHWWKNDLDLSVICWWDIKGFIVSGLYAA